MGYAATSMQEMHNGKFLVVAGICDSNKSRTQHHRSLKLGLKLNYLNIINYYCCKVANSSTQNRPNLLGLMA